MLMENTFCWILIDRFPEVGNTTTEHVSNLHGIWAWTMRKTYTALIKQTPMTKQCHETITKDKNDNHGILNKFYKKYSQIRFSWGWVHDFHKYKSNTLKNF